MRTAAAKAAAQVAKVKAAAVKGPDIELADRVGKLTDALTDVMQALHGGEWCSMIDHDVGMVIVRSHRSL